MTPGFRPGFISVTLQPFWRHERLFLWNLLEDEESQDAECGLLLTQADWVATLDFLMACLGPPEQKQGHRCQSSNPSSQPDRLQTPGFERCTEK